jgi:hypothetical protein
LLLVLAAPVTHAETVPDLYRTAVAVAEQSPAELKRAAPLGLAEVLVRVSGRSAAATAPALREPLAGAERYVEQYRYERAADGALQLALQFAPSTIDNLLRGAGLPVWHADRARVVILLAQPDGRLVDAASGDWPAKLKAAAARRGVPILIPATAPAGLSADDLLREDSARAWQAAQSYHGDAALLGRIDAAGDVAGALVIGGQHTPIPAGANDILDRAADLLAARYAAPVATASSRNALQLRVSNIENFADYAGLLGYLGAMGSLKASPRAIDGNVVTLIVSGDSGADQLAQQWAIDRRLLPEPAEPGADAALLRYRWQGRGG